jgi:hypothetical protein
VLISFHPETAPDDEPDALVDLAAPSPSPEIETGVETPAPADAAPVIDNLTVTVAMPSPTPAQDILETEPAGISKQPASPEPEITQAAAQKENLNPRLRLFVTALVNPTSRSRLRLNSLPVHIKGLEPEPSGPRIDIEPDMSILNLLEPAELTSVVYANKVFGETEDLRGLAANLDNSVLANWAAAYLEAPKPKASEGLVEAAEKKPRRSGSKTKVVTMSVAEALRFYVPAPSNEPLNDTQEKKASAPGGEKDGEDV